MKQKAPQPIVYTSIERVERFRQMNFRAKIDKMYADKYPPVDFALHTNNIVVEDAYNRMIGKTISNKTHQECMQNHIDYLIQQANGCTKN